MPKSLTSENLAKRFGFDRKTEDQLAFESHQKAAIAQKNGWKPGTTTDGNFS